MSKLPLKDLQELEDAGIITRETSVQIHNYYLAKKQSSPNTFIVILGILGALLTGAGVLLIVAHNWDSIPMSFKTFLAFLPLLLAQTATAYTLLKRKTDRSWIECSTVFLFFAIGSCMALVSQLYQVNGSLSSFLLMWVMLSFPLIYFLSANIVSLFCIAAITLYAAIEGYYERYSDIPYLYAVIAGCMIPHYYQTSMHKGKSHFAVLLNWFWVISITISLGAFTGKGAVSEEWIFLLYCMLFCLYYQVGLSPYYRSKRLLSNPFLVTGTLGIIISLLVWSFTFIWSGYRIPQLQEILGTPLFYLIITGMVLFLIVTRQNYRVDSSVLRDPVSYSFAILLVLLVFFHQYPSIASFMVNVWTIVIAIFYIRLGAQRNHLGIVNFGLIILATLAVCRFFDDKIPFVWRGIFFLVTGVAFFMANYLLIRDRKHKLKNNPHA